MKKIITPQESEFFNEGKILINDEIIILKDIYVITQPEISITEIHNKKLLNEGIKSFNATFSNKEDIDKLIMKTFTIAIEDEICLKGCKLNKLFTKNQRQATGEYSILYSI